MFRTILLPIDGSPFSETATTYAIEAARHFGASIRALHVIDLKRLAAPLVNDVAVCLGLSSLPDFQETMRGSLESLGTALLETVSRACSDAGVPVTTHLVSGIVADTICREAHAADLVVMGHRGEASDWGSRILGSVFEATIRSINRPVLVVSKFRQSIRRFLVAYDGSNHAASVLGVVAEVCGSEELPLHVLVADEGVDDVDGTIERASAFLEAHGVAWTLERATGDPAEAIIAKAEEIGADVIAMGAYGHSRIRELLVGSTTEYVLRRAGCPVLVYR